MAENGNRLRPSESGGRLRHPPFGAGNQLARKHGAHSKDAVSSAAGKFKDRLLEERPWLENKNFEDAIEAFARNRARIELISAWLDEHGLFSQEGQPRPAAEYLLRLERLGIELLDRLGLTPSAAARLHRELGVSRTEDAVVQDLEQGRKLRLAAEVRSDGSRDPASLSGHE